MSIRTCSRIKGLLARSAIPRALLIAMRCPLGEATWLGRCLRRNDSAVVHHASRESGAEGQYRTLRRERGEPLAFKGAAVKAG
jgi:hypothetical protein